MNSLEKKYNLYRTLIKKLQDKDGFIESEHCDSLLWTGLTSCVSGFKVDIEKCLNKQDGTWHRRPSQDCWPKHSKSTISRDMFLGLLAYVIKHKRTDLADQVVKYAITHLGFMGRGTGIIGLSRINIMPPLFMSYLLISKWGKYFKWLNKIIPADFLLFSKKSNGYRAHLSILHCCLRNKITKEDNYKEIFKFHSKRQPSNALFRYLNGDIKIAKTLLTDPKLFPPDRLPTRGDRQASWLWQRDTGDDWEPATSDKKKSHTGGDFLFLYSLIKGDF